MVLGTTPITMINTVEELRDMIDLIKHHSKEIAVDLEVCIIPWLRRVFGDTCTSRIFLFNPT